MVGKSSENIGVWVSTAGQQLGAWNWSWPQVVPPVLLARFSQPRLGFGECDRGREGVAR